MEGDKDIIIIIILFILLYLTTLDPRQPLLNYRGNSQVKYCFEAE